MKKNSFWFGLAFLLCSGGVNAQTTNVAPAPAESNTYQKINERLSPFSAESARKWLHGRFSELKDCDARLTDSIASPGGVHLHFQQTLQGVAIFGASIKVNASKNGKIINALNNLKSVSGLTPSTFALNEENFLFKPEIKGLKIISTSRTYFISENGTLRAAYRILTDGTDAQDAFENVFDAETGALLLRRSLAARRTTNGEGKGYAFNPDPLTSAGKFYETGTDYADKGDATNSALDAQRINVTLKDLVQDKDTLFLSGPYVRIVDMFQPKLTPAYSLDGNFLYNRAQSGFEDVNAYYHIDTYQRYVQSIGFDNLYQTPLAVDTHGDMADNSSFTPNGAASYLRFGVGGVDDAEDADVIVHEYGHALSFYGSPNTNSGVERRGLDEGIGDYIAATYSRKLSSFRWNELYTWDGHNEFWDGRMANTSETYPVTKQNAAGDIYRYGTLWTSTLMQIWESVGGDVCDRLFFQALYMNGASMTLTDGAMNFLDADTMLYDGAHSAKILQAFCGVDLVTGDLCLAAAIEEQIATQKFANIYPNPTDDFFTLRLTLPNGDYRGVKYEVWDPLGRVVISDDAQGAFTRINVENLSSGIYHLHVTRNDVSIARMKVMKK